MKIPNFKKINLSPLPLFKRLKLNFKASAITLCFTYLYLIAEIIYKVKFEKAGCTWEIILLFLIFSVYGILKKLFNTDQLPCDNDGNPLPTGDSPVDKKKRNAFYKKSALIYSAIFAVITTIACSCSSLLSNVDIGEQLFFNSKLPDFILAAIISIIFLPIIYIFAYFIEHLWYEYKLSVYNELIEQEEAEEKRHKAILLKLQQELKEESKPAPKRRGRPPKKTAETADE